MPENAIKSIDYSEDNKIVVHNDYIMAVHPDNMSLNSMKLFRLIIAQCRKDDRGFFTYCIKVDDLSKYLNVNRADLKKDLKTMCKQIMQMLLYVFYDYSASWEYKHIFEVCRYDSITESITIQLHQDMEHFFLRLHGRFTRIPAIACMLMQSKYSIRLYELICKKIMSNFPYANVSTVIVLNLSELQNLLTKKQKSYDQISNFKNRVLLPALAEIEKCSNWKIERQDIKDGRTIKAFALTIWDSIGYQVVQDCIARGVQIPAATDPYGKGFFD